MAGHQTHLRKSEGATTIRRQLSWLAFLGVCGLVIFASVSYMTLSRIEVNGRLYRNIRLSNHLVADYVPPSESLLEPALLCTKLVEARDETSAHGYEVSLKNFERAYGARYADYMTLLPEGPLKSMMRGESHETAQQYFKLADQLIVLIDQGRQEDARRLLVGTMNPLYDRHAAAVDKIVIRANEEARSTEILAAREVRAFTAAMFAIGLLLLIVVCTLAWLIAKGVAKQADRILQSEESLLDSEELYRSTFDQAAVGIIHTSFEGVILRCNTRFAEILGYPMEEILGRTFQDFTPPEYRSESLALMQRIISGVSHKTAIEKPYVRKDGSYTWVRLTSSVQFDTQGQALHLAAFIEDINARRATEEDLAVASRELQMKEARYRAVFQTSRDALSITRLSDGMNIEVNQAMLDLLGYEDWELEGQSSLGMGVWPDATVRAHFIEKLRKESSFRDEKTQFRRKNGEVFWVLLSATLMNIEGTKCAFTVARDLSDVKAAEDRIKDLAFYDRVTRLPNRRLLLDRLHQTLSDDQRSNSQKILIFINLDDFKTVNDSYGHQIGDLLLQQVAHRLTECVRGADTVARFGGDEFVVMVKGISETSEGAADEAEVIGEAILAALCAPYLLDGHECKITARIGITIFGNESKSPHEVLQQAGIAIHQAKNAGSNSIRFFSPALQAAVHSRATLKGDLLQAIDANQFMLYYQPQVNSTGLMGSEALIRWQHPVRGIVPPYEFIPLAEETGLILALGDWVFEAACKQTVAWTQRKAPAHLQLAVNISSQQFCQADFVENILATIARTGANPKSLKLELTESMLASDIEDVIAKMVVLKSHGFSFALDDFGTGYSSLSYLKRLPLDQLKIDRAFVSDILVDVASATIAQTIISLGRAMGLSVIAEGVETEEQREFLASLGTHLFQGYLFSRPLPLEEFERSWMRFS